MKRYGLLLIIALLFSFCSYAADTKGPQPSPDKKEEKKKEEKDSKKTEIKAAPGVSLEHTCGTMCFSVEGDVKKFRTKAGMVQFTLAKDDGKAKIVLWNESEYHRKVLFQVLANNEVENSHEFCVPPPEEKGKYGKCTINFSGMAGHTVVLTLFAEDI